LFLPFANRKATRLLQLTLPGFAAFST